MENAVGVARGGKPNEMLKDEGRASHVIKPYFTSSSIGKVFSRSQFLPLNGCQWKEGKRFGQNRVPDVPDFQPAVVQDQALRQDLVSRVSGTRRWHGFL